MISFRSKKRLGHAQIDLRKGFNSKFPTSIPAPSYGSTPPDTYAFTCTQNAPVELSTRYQKNFIREQ